MTASEPADVEVHRLCRFDLDLTCGHTVTVTLNGWYPVSIPCCERLGGSWYGGIFYPYDSGVDFVRCLSERYVARPAGSVREPLVVLGRRDRTDVPYEPTPPGLSPHTGRFPDRVGAAIPVRVPVRGTA